MAFKLNPFSGNLDFYEPAPSLSGYVPYTGATADVDLGENNLALTGTLELGDATTDALIIGDIGGDARGVGSIDIQQSRTASTQVASGQDSTAIGNNNTASGRNGIAIGDDNTVATSTYMYDPAQQQGIAIGKSNNVTTVGYYASTYPIAIGRSNTVNGSNGFCVGKTNTLTAASGDSLVIGTGNTASGSASFVFGQGCTSSAANGVAIGSSNSVVGSNSVSIGRINRASGTQSFNLGVLARTLGSYGVAIGSFVSSFINPYASTFMAGAGAANLILNAVGLSFNGNDNPTEKIHSTGNILASNITTLGAEKITNGTFTGSATGWTVGSFAYSANTVTKTANGTSALTQTSAAMVTPLVAGEYYLLTFNFTALSVGSIVVSCAGVTIATIDLGTDTSSVTKAFSFIFKATSTANLSFAPSNTSRITAIDNVSLKKITGGDLIGLGSLYLGQDDTNRMQISVGATGTVTLNANGAAAGFTFSDSLALPYVEKTANFTITTNDHTINCTANSFTVTLPTAVGVTGRIYNIKNSGVGVITVATTSSQTIDGALTQTLNQYDGITVQSTNAAWIII